MPTSTSTQSIFSEFSLGTDVDGNLFAVGLSGENWPASGAGYPVLAAEQFFTSTSYPPLWVAGEGGAEDSYLPQVSDDDSPLLYTQLACSTLSGTPMVLGLTSDGSLAVAATQASNAAWSAGEVLTVDSSLTDCAGFLVIPSGADNTVAGSPLVGITDGGVPVVAAVYDGDWSTQRAGPIPLNSSASSYTAITSLYSVAADQWYLFGISGGTPYVIATWAVDYHGARWTAGSPNGSQANDSLNVYSLGTGSYASLYPVASGNTLYLLALDGEGIPYIASVQGASGSWTAGGPHASDAYQSLCPATDAVGNIVVFGVNAESGIDLISVLLAGTTEWSTPANTLPTIYEYGQPVTFTSVAAANGPDENLHCIALGTNGQLYEVGIWNQTSLLPGQGRLPTEFSQNASSAAVFASQLFVDLNAMATFSTGIATDLSTWDGNAPLDMTATAAALAPQVDPMAGIPLPSTPPDVLMALNFAANNNIALWAGSYGTPAAGTGWPAATTPAPIFITFAGAVYYGSYDLGNLGWTYANGVLSWPTPTAAQIAAGAPPVAGTLTFTMTEQSDSQSGYEMSFSGTLNGTPGPAPASGAQPPTTAALSALSSFTLASKSLSQGGTTTATLTLAAAAPCPGAAVVIVASSTQLVVPQCVVVPAGQTTATFTVGPFIAPAPLFGKVGVTVSALVGTTALTRTVSVSATAVHADADVDTDADAAPDGADDGTFTCTFSPASVPGGDSTTLTIKMNTAPTVATSFKVMSQSYYASLEGDSDVLVITPPSSSVSATIETVAVMNQVTIGFWVTNMTAEPRIQLDPEPLLTVTHAPVPGDYSVVSVEASPSTVVGGSGSVNATITLNTVSPFTLTLDVSSDNSAVSWPASVTVPAFSSSITVPLTTKTVTAVTQVTLTASNPKSTAAAVSGALTLDLVPLVNTLTPTTTEVHNADTLGVAATLKTAVAHAVTLTLSCNTANLVPQTPSFTIPAGSTSAAWTLDVNPPSKDPVTCYLTVTGGELTFGDYVTVYPDTTTAINIAGIVVGAGVTIGVAVVGGIFGWFLKRFKGVARNAVGIATQATDAAAGVPEFAADAVAEVPETVNTIPSRPAALVLEE